MAMYVVFTQPEVEPQLARLLAMNSAWRAAATTHARNQGIIPSDLRILFELSEGK